MNATIVTTLRIAAFIPALDVLSAVAAANSGASTDPASAVLALDQAPHALHALMPVLPDELAGVDGAVEFSLRPTPPAWLPGPK